MVEDTQDERDIYLAKKTRHHHETLTMVLGKGKRCKTRLDCFLCFLRKHTWLKEPQHGGSILFFHRLAYGLPAHPALLAGSSPCTAQGASYVSNGNGWTSIGLERQGLKFFVIQLYLKTGETRQSKQNAEILGQLRALHHRR